MTTTTTSAYAESAARFATYTHSLTLTVLKGEGSYRHLQFGKRGAVGWFEIVTWPGYLTINGDCSRFTFGRVGDDAFRLFRQPDINPGYWVQYSGGDESRARSYSGDLLRAELVRQVDAAKAKFPGLQEEFAKFLEDADLDTSREDALSEADQFEHWPPLADRLRDTFRFVGLDTDDWEDWDTHYIRVCHAIRWGIGQYDDSKATR